MINLKGNALLMVYLIIKWSSKSDGDGCATTNSTEERGVAVVVQKE